MTSQPLFNEKKEKFQEHIEASLKDSYKKYSRNNVSDIVSNSCPDSATLLSQQSPASYVS